jgi:ABC-type lipoprotein export system ATPase subunit
MEYSGWFYDGDFFHGCTPMTQSTVQLEQVCSIAQGERIAVMGPSGSGKSSLLNLVCGLDDPTSGTVSVAGIRISDLNDDQRTRPRREKIGTIFQTFNLLPTLSGGRERRPSASSAGYSFAV